VRHVEPAHLEVERSSAVGCGRGDGRLAMDHRYASRSLTSARSASVAVVVSEGAAAIRSPAGVAEDRREGFGAGISGNSGAMTTDGMGISSIVATSSPGGSGARCAGR